MQKSFLLLLAIAFTCSHCIGQSDSTRHREHNESISILSPQVFAGIQRSRYFGIGAIKVSEFGYGYMLTHASMLLVPTAVNGNLDRNIYGLKAGVEAGPVLYSADPPWISGCAPVGLELKGFTDFNDRGIIMLAPKIGITVYYVTFQYGLNIPFWKNSLSDALGWHQLEAAVNIPIFKRE